MDLLRFIGLLFIGWVLLIVLVGSFAAIWERVSYEWRVRRIYRTYRRGL